MATRLTLLPLQLHGPEQEQGQLRLLHARHDLRPEVEGGRWEERVLLHRLLAEELPQQAERLLHVLRVGVSLERFRERAADRGCSPTSPWDAGSSTG